jgi:hypothetical protein
MAEFRHLKALSQKYGADVINELITQLNNNKKKASGNLARSFDAEVTDAETGIKMIVTGADYAQYVDKGRMPGKYVPVSVLEKWAKLKGIPQSAVFLINRKIYRKGIPATNFISTAITKKKSVLNDMVTKAYKEDMQEYLDEIADKITD